MTVDWLACISCKGQQGCMDGSLQQLDVHAATQTEMPEGAHANKHNNNTQSHASISHAPAHNIGAHSINMT